MAWTDHIAGSFGFGTAPFAKYKLDEEIAMTAIAAAKSEGVTREEFARHIAEYPGKYIRSEQVLRERVRDDAARLDQLWKVLRQNHSELALMPETDTDTEL
jgi:hypothetical protein